MHGSSVQTSGNCKSERLNSRQAINLIVISLCVLFFHGCGKSNIRLTAGPVAPFAEVNYKSDAPLQSTLQYFSPFMLLVNVGTVCLGLHLSTRYSWMLNQLFSSRPFLLSVILVAMLFNSVLYFGWLWMNMVFTPIIYIQDALIWMLGEPDDPWLRQLLVGFSSRFHFLFCLTVTIALAFLGRRLARNYVFVHPDRWWQFNLGSLLTMMLVVGTALGMLLRLFHS